MNHLIVTNTLPAWCVSYEPCVIISLVTFLDVEDGSFHFLTHVARCCRQTICHAYLCPSETCASPVWDSRFRLILELCFLVARDVLVGRLSVRSWIIFKFSFDGSSGGASGHGVRLAGTVISRGGSIIHLHAWIYIRLNVNCTWHHNL